MQMKSLSEPVDNAERKKSQRPFDGKLNMESKKISCKFCGYEHPPEKKKCPAWGKTRKKCRQRNHFAKKCFRRTAVYNTGLSVSSEIFQKHLHGLPGVKCIADDVLIHGANDADHDSNLERFMGRYQQKGIKLNSQKLELKAKKIPFHGHLLTTEGLKPDPEKVRAFVEMPRPEGRDDVFRLNGMVNYLKLTYVVFFLISLMS